MFTNRFLELSDAIKQCSYSSLNESLDEANAIQKAIDLISSTKFQGGIVYVIGNGGSAGIASHFSTDLIKCLGIASQTLYDSNLMTCLSNDWGYENIFSYPLSKLLRKEDLLVAISSSGKSPNIIKAAETALTRGASLLTLSGFSQENPLRQLGHLNFWVDKSDYGLVETAHFFLLHTLIDFWHKYSSTETGHAKNIRNDQAENQVSARNY